jgi:hypothetical protein
LSACRNEKEDCDLASSVISLAQRIRVSDQELKLLIQKDFKAIETIHEQRKAMGKPIKTAPSLYTINGIGSKIYGDTLLDCTLSSRQHKK